MSSLRGIVTFRTLSRYNGAAHNYRAVLVENSQVMADFMELPFRVHSRFTLYTTSIELEFFPPV